MNFRKALLTLPVMAACEADVNIQRPNFETPASDAGIADATETPASDAGIADATENDSRDTEVADGSTNPCSGRRLVTRGEVAVALANCFNLEPEECSIPEPPPENLCCFVDKKATAEENEAFQALCEAGIIERFPDGRWRPRDAVTSAVFAALITRTFGLEYIPDEGDETWYKGYYRALEQAGLLPPGESENPNCSPSEEFIERVLNSCGV